MTFHMTKPMLKFAQLQRTFLQKAATERIPELYYGSCEADFESIKKALPKRTAGEVNILDIGAGLGGIDILLHNYYFLTGAEPHIYVLDKTETADKIKYGYSNSPSAYNNLDLTRDFFEMNGIEPGRCLFTEKFPEPVKFDLIISLISCGFHYSISQYISFIQRSIHPKTIVIFDIRKFSGQFDSLHNVFGWVNCLKVTEKYKRMVCRL